MANLLRAEFYRLWRKKSFWGIAVFSVFLGSVLMLDRRPLLTAADFFYGSLYSNPILYILIIIFCALFIGEDFENRTVQALIGAGHSRGAILAAKAVSSLTACVIILGAPLLTDGLAGLLLFGPGEAVPAAGLAAQGGLILLCFCAMGGLLFLAAFLFQDVGKTLAVPLAAFFLMLAGLNGSMSGILSLLLPIGQLRLLAVDRSAPRFAAFAAVDVCWLAVCFLVAGAVFARRDLK